MKQFMCDLTPAETQSLIALLITRKVQFTATPYKDGKLNRYKVEWEDKPNGI